MSDEQKMSAWIRLMLQEIDQKQAEAEEAAEEARRRQAGADGAQAASPAGAAPGQRAAAGKS